MLHFSFDVFLLIAGIVLGVVFDGRITAEITSFRADIAAVRADIAKAFPAASTEASAAKTVTPVAAAK
jgi:hypothetical protein